MSDMESIHGAGAWAQVLVALGPLALAWSIAFVSHSLQYALSAGVVSLASPWFPALRGECAARFEAVDEAQRRMELRSSLEAGAIFSLQFVPLNLAVMGGYSQVYFDFGRFGAAYGIMSFLTALVIHDTYFYWTHRWMHRRSVFRRVHLHHHRSVRPTAWAAFSFHPIESLIQGGAYALILLVVPIHVGALGAFLLWATVYSAMIHSGHDLFLVRGSHERRIHGRLLSTALEHDAHHGGANGNFGLYFSFWDQVMGTYVPCAPGAAATHHEGPASPSARKFAHRESLRQKGTTRP